MASCVAVAQPAAAVGPVEFCGYTEVGGEVSVALVLPETDGRTVTRWLRIGARIGDFRIVAVEVAADTVWLDHGAGPVALRLKRGGVLAAESRADPAAPSGIEPVPTYDRGSAADSERALGGEGRGRVGGDT